ncbi:MAG TPA: amino acid ABC transporter substrate-binding protein [Dehalococcoidales bacterium]|nr:amino acid ABC transporter substrate-binding protein [Dehalococcoidales bacterium]
MKKLIIPVVILVICALFITACGTGATPAATKLPAKDKILIGMSRPLSGPLKAVGDSAFKPIYDTMVKMWNDEGGIFIAEYNKKLPIELKIYDNKSDIPTMTKQIEQLIVQDKVDYLWAPCGTADLFAAAPIANKYQKVLLTMEGGATAMKGMLPSLPFVFVPLSFSDWDQMPVLADILSKAGAKTAYIVYIADLHGIEYSGVAGIELPKRGISVVASKALPPEMTDFSLIIKDAMASKADAFLCFAYPAQNMPMTGQAIGLGYNPNAFLLGPGGNFGFYLDAYGPATEGVLCWASWNRKVSPELNAMADKLYAGKPVAAQDWWGHALYWGAMEFWKQAVEKTGSLDNVKLQQTMATSRFKTVLGDTFFTNGLMAKESQPGQVGQWQKGVLEIVGGNKTTAPLIYPKPQWPAK